MAKLKNPLLSFNARNTLGKVITFTRRRHVNIAEKTPIPQDPKSLAQLSWRHMYIKAVALWHALSAAEQQDWQSQASRRQMTGFAWFMSQALKPNPGLYLPLQGGTMAGAIDMAKYHLLRLPAPIDAQEALRLSEYTANIAPYLYNEGARVYHNANQNIAHDIETTLAFNREEYDSDAIHDTIVNNSRLTCKTAGKYLVAAAIRWQGNAIGYRLAGVKLNGGWIPRRIGIIIQAAPAAVNTDSPFAHVLHLAVNNYVECVVRQTSTIGLTVDTKSSFEMQRIGA